MYRNHIRVGVLLSALAAFSSISRAQTTPAGVAQPLPPVAPLGPDKTVGDALPDPADLSPGSKQQIIPDSRPLAGAQELTLGSLANAHSFLLPSFSVITQAGADPFTTGASHPDVLSTSYLTGRLGVNQVSSRSSFLLDYVAGASFSNEPAMGNSLIQGLDATETIQWSRWTLLFGDQFSYLSSSPFGFGGVGGVKNLGVSLGNGAGSSPGISSSFTPTDSVYVDGLPRINNTAIGQATYALSHRASLNFIGSYGILDFVNSPLQDSSIIGFQGGFNYLLSRLNSISVFYRFDTLSFLNLLQGIQDHSAEVAFGRRITGRLSWQVGGGPSIEVYQRPISGSGTSVSPRAFTGLVYRLRYTGFGLSYSHSLTTGSGVLPGAQTDVFSGRVTRTLAKSWDTSLEGSYSRNQAIRQTLGTSVSASPNTWFTTARVSRLFVGYGAFSLSYNVAGQSSLATICTLPSCKVASLVQTVSLGYTWGLRPVQLE
jgi:hypothetical protein